MPRVITVRSVGLSFAAAADLRPIDALHYQ
jgi:hypothetical protein